MTLKQFTDKYGTSTAFLARKLGVSRAHMHKIIRGDALPSRKLALKIEEWTENDVPIETWYQGLREVG